ncbi:MAG: ABC transporter ATP-binding protein [Planctomycetaceae bacterium]|nr:MAG: ABC transporter ATP-binding protein [Planctomycetaceae bacterium]
MTSTAIHPSSPASPPGEAPAVWTQGLGKRYGNFDALNDLTLEIARGEVFGLLGPNGAGKTTFLRTLLGYLRRTSGSAEVLGIDPEVDPVGVRRFVSYLPGDARLPRQLRGHAVLRFFADIRPDGDLENALAIADRLELDLRRHVGFMSTGMRQKLAIAAVIGTRSQVLILDEPTANLDPTIRSRVLELVLETKREGRTVIFSSHVLSEIEEVCDRVALLRQGRLALHQKLAELRARHRILATRMSTTPGAAASLPAVPPELAESISQVAFDGPELMIETVGDLAPVLGWLASLDLTKVRAETFGLRAVYDSVHHHEAVSV